MIPAALVLDLVALGMVPVRGPGLPGLVLYKVRSLAIILQEKKRLDLFLQKRVLTSHANYIVCMSV